MVSGVLPAAGHLVRAPLFHVFESFARAWPDVCPGDVVISPETVFQTYDEAAVAVVTARKPMLVIARLDGRDFLGEPTHFLASTFIVYSITRGFLVTLMDRLEDDD